MTIMSERQVERTERRIGRTLDLVEIFTGDVDQSRQTWEDVYEDTVTDLLDDDTWTEEDYELGEAA
ncbi:MAG: hypothetical protein CV089_02305 [Nitrospira sp. WS110]|nr:hypothetical protein [Nitrospira sp. WS110]